MLDKKEKQEVLASFIKHPWFKYLEEVVESYKLDLWQSALSLNYENENERKLLNTRKLQYIILQKLLENIKKGWRAKVIIPDNTLKDL